MSETGVPEDWGQELCSLCERLLTPKPPLPSIKFLEASRLLYKLGYEWDTKKEEWRKDYSTTAVYIPPQHRATPRGN